MSTVVADISMSLDGFVTGPEPNLEHGLGVGGGLFNSGSSIRTTLRKTGGSSNLLERAPVPW